MPNQFLSDEFGDIEDYFVTDYWLIDNFVGDTLWVWGAGNEGRLGTNDTTSRQTPVTTFAGGTTWKQVSAGIQFTSAIKTDGTLWGWGRADSGQLGTNDTTQRNTPVTTFAGGTNWKYISSGGYHNAAIKTDGSLWVWGEGGSGRLGTNDTTPNRNTPVTTFAGGTNWKQVSAGGAHTAAIKTDGTLWTWGFNGFRQLGINSTDGNINTPVTTFAGGNNWKQVACGSEHTAAIKTDGSLWTWGTNSDGRLGINNTTSPILTPVTTFSGGNTWKSVACGNKHTVAIKTDGSLWTWGLGGDGQLGDFTTINRSTPVTTFVGGNNWKHVSAGLQFTSAIKTDGTLWGWGKNDNSQLGNFSDIARSTPVTTFAGGNNWKSVASGQNHTIAVKSGLNVDLS
jgi:alpha-tubulin suppressor-like RCC1 family protein